MSFRLDRGRWKGVGREVVFFRRVIRASRNRPGLTLLLGISCLLVAACRKPAEEAQEAVAKGAAKAETAARRGAASREEIEHGEVASELRALSGLSGGDLRSAAFFKDPGPLDPLLARLSPGEFLELAERMGFHSPSQDWELVMERYLHVKVQADPAGCRAFLLSRKDPRLTTCAVAAYATVAPEMGLEVIEQTMEGTGSPSRGIQLSLLIARATLADPLRALNLVGMVPDSGERLPMALEALGEAHEGQTSSVGGFEKQEITPAALISVIGQNLETYSDVSRADLFQWAGKILQEKPVVEVVPEIDDSLAWQRRMLLGYLEARATKRQGGEDVRSYLESEAGKGFTPAERGRILSREGAGD